MTETIAQGAANEPVPKSTLTRTPRPAISCR